MKKVHLRAAMQPAEYVTFILDVFTSAGDPIRAEQQRAYMRHQFEYCGLTAPQWLGMLKEIFDTHGTYTGAPLKKFVLLCFEQEYRELHYAGLEMMQKRLTEQDEKWISVLEKLIQTQSWWDTVDWLGKLTGIFLKKYPELQYTVAYKWIHSDHMWLQRVAIIHQLAYREQTDEKLLFDLIRIQSGNPEFFIRKACGWALRQYAKTNPAAVEKFLKKQTLSPLTIREARKQLDKLS